VQTLALTAYSIAELASWITLAQPAQHQVPPLVSQGAPCLVLWAREDCTRNLTILVDAEGLVSFFVSFVSVHHGPGFGGS
jgi:hypothetical protein